MSKQQKALGKRKQSKGKKKVSKQIDYLKEPKSNEDFFFNKAPVSLDQVRPNKKSKKQKTAIIRTDISDDEQVDYLQNVDTEKDEFFDQEGIFALATQDVHQYFRANRSFYESITKIKDLKLKEGTLVLATIADKGPQGKYLTLNMSRNRKLFLSQDDLDESEHNFSLSQLYSIGETIIASIIPSHKEGHLQISLKPSLFNQELVFDEIFENQIISGQISDQEEKGAKVKINTQRSEIKGYILAKDATNLQKHKIGLFQVLRKDTKRKIVYLSQNVNQVLKISKALVEENEGKDLSHLVKPGNLVLGKLVKVIENGLVVQIFFDFIGFVFADHLKNDISSYKKGLQLQLRVICVDFDQKTIFLSEKTNHLDLGTPVKPQESLIGQKFNSFLIQQKNYGGSYFVSVDCGEKGSIQGFLHKSHFEVEKEVQEHQLIKKKILCKEFNNFENYYIFSCKPELLKAKEFGWTQLEAGQILNGVIEKIVRSEKISFLIKINQNVKGFVQKHHLCASGELKTFLKQIKENGQVKVRVLKVDSEKKKAELTMRTQFLEETTAILKSFSEAKVGNPFLGLVEKQLENKNYVVRFYNNIHGILNQKELIDQKVPKIGEILKFFIKAIKQNYFILSLNNKDFQQNDTNQLQQEIESALGKVTFLDQFNSESIQSLQIGQLHEYTPDIQMQEKAQLLSAHLFAFQSVSQPKHKALLIQPHFSDFESLFETTSDQLLRKRKKVAQQGKIIGKLENNIILISFKPSVLRQKEMPLLAEDLKKNEIYPAFIDRQISNGRYVIKINSALKGILSVSSVKTGATSAIVKTQEFDEFVEEDAEVIADKKTFTYGQTCFVTMKKVDVEKVKDVQFRGVSELADVNKRKMKIFEEVMKHYWDQQNQIKDRFLKTDQHWQQYKIGNFVLGKVLLVKSYGYIVQIQDPKIDEIAGFIMSNMIGVFSKNDEVFCQILDVDYDKKVFDLQVVKSLSNEQKASLLANTNYLEENYKKAALGATKTITNARVLLIKDDYSICCLEKDPLCPFILHTNLLTIDKPTQLKGETIAQAQIIQKYSDFVVAFQVHPSESLASEAQDLKTGQFVAGKVTKRQGNNYFVSVSNQPQSYQFKLHVAQIEQFSLAQEKNLYDKPHQFKVLSIQSKSNSAIVDLTFLQKHLTLKEFELEKSLILDSSTKNVKVQGVLKNLKFQAIHPLTFELDHNNMGCISSFSGLVIPEKCEDLKLLKKNFKPGQVYKLIVLEEISPNFFRLALENVPIKAQISTGDLVIARVCSITDNFVRVQIQDSVFANIDLTEINDILQPNPQNTLRLHSFLLARVILQDNQKGILAREDLQDNSKGIFVSLRESVLNTENYTKYLAPQAPTLQFKQFAQEFIEKGDLRYLCAKLGPNSVKENMLFIGIVHQINEKGCFVKLSYNVTVRVDKTQLCDERKDQVIKKGQLVIGRIINIKQDGKLDGSLKKSTLKYGVGKKITDFQESQLVDFIVQGYSGQKAVLLLLGSKLRAKIHLNDFLDEENDSGDKYLFIEQILPLGTVARGKITEILKEPKLFINGGINGGSNQKITEIIKEPKLFINVGSNQKFLSEQEKTRNLDCLSDAQNALELFESIRELNKAAQKTPTVQPEIPHEITLTTAQVEEEIPKQDELLEEQPGKDIEIEEERPEQEEADDEDVQEPQSDERDSDQVNELISDASQLDENELQDEIIDLKKKSKKNKEFKRFQEEAKLRQKEQEQMNEEELQLSSKADFEKQILGNPNNSLLWTKYAAFCYENGGLEAAKEVLERGLKVISFRNETEKMNLWTVYLNLEFNFGNQQDLIKIFQRAQQVCNPKLIYFKLLELYRTSENSADLLFGLSNAMIKKSKHSLKAWLHHLKNVIIYKKHKQLSLQECQHELKQILQRSLQSLKKQKHLQMMTQYSRILYAEGLCEQGRTNFESILNNFPKRTDIWSIYIDCEIKFGEAEQVRNLFERCCTLSLKPRKMKFFFEKYLKFEISQNNQSQVELVKQKAQDYVQSKIEQEQNDQEQ